MKTKFFNYLLMGAFAMMSSVAFISCSSDDDDTAPAGDGGNNAPRDEYGVYTEGKKLKKIQIDFSYYGGYNIVTFDYSSNRLSEVYDGELSYTYKWDNGKVELIYDKSVARTYILNNGLVTKIIDSSGFETTLSYNDNRQLIKTNSEWGTKKYTWNNDAVTKITRGAEETIFVYDGYYEPCQQGYYPPTHAYDTFWYMGYGADFLLYAHPELFGLRMNSLPRKIIEDGVNIDCSYGINSEGCVFISSQRNRYSYEYFWE